MPQAASVSFRSRSSRARDTATARSQEPAVHFAPRALSLRSEAIFASGADEHVREFLLRAFALQEIEAVSLLKGQSKIDVELRPSAFGVRVWRKLGALLRGASAPDGATRERIANQIAALERGPWGALSLRMRSGAEVPVGKKHRAGVQAMIGRGARG